MSLRTQRFKYPLVVGKYYTYDITIKNSHSINSNNNTFYAVWSHSPIATIFGQCICAFPLSPPIFVGPYFLLYCIS